MTPVHYSKCRLSLRRPAEQYDNYRNPPPGRTRLDAEGVAESAIQRFEVCFYCLWKVLKRHLIADFGLADPPNDSTPRTVCSMPLRNSGCATPTRVWTRRTTTTARGRERASRSCWTLSRTPPASTKR